MGAATTSDLRPLTAYYTAEELDDPVFVRSELAWYRDVFERMRDRDLAQIEAQRRATDPVTAEAFYGPATRTSPAAALSSAAGGGAPVHSPSRAGAHPLQERP